jgi:hypothetical protein
MKNTALTKSRSFILRIKKISDKSVEKLSSHTTFNNFFENPAIYEITWKNTVEPVRPQMAIWRIRISRLIPKAINTHSEHVIHIAFPLQQLFHARASILGYSALPVLLIISTEHGLTNCHTNSSFGHY